MKKIIKITSLLIWALITFSACEQNDEIQFVANPVQNPQIVTANTEVVLNENSPESLAYTLVWKEGDFGEVTPVNYNVEIAASGTNFENPIVAGTTTDTFFDWTVSEINDDAISVGLPSGQEGAIDVRVVAFLGAGNGENITSNVVVLTLSPFSNAAPRLFMVGRFQEYYGRNAWTPTEAFEMKYIGDGSTQVFDAYIKLGAEDGFKFISAAEDWGILEGNYGTISGAQDGNLENSGGSGDIKGGENGLYYVRVDLDALSYQLVNMQWGIIGDATPNGWGDETAMNYDFEQNVFTLTQDLVAAELKFRSRNTGNAIFGAGEDWKFNVGNSGDDAVAEDTGDGNFTISPAGNYNIELGIGILGEANATISLN